MSSKIIGETRWVCHDGKTLNDKPKCTNCKKELDFEKDCYAITDWY